jgi:hypothetical protein
MPFPLRGLIEPLPRLGVDRSEHSFKVRERQIQPLVLPEPRREQPPATRPGEHSCRESRLRPRPRSISHSATGDVSPTPGSTRRSLPARRRLPFRASRASNPAPFVKTADSDLKTHFLRVLGLYQRCSTTHPRVLDIRLLRILAYCH